MSGMTPGTSIAFPSSESEYAQFGADGALRSFTPQGTHSRAKVPLMARLLLTLVVAAGCISPAFASLSSKESRSRLPVTTTQAMQRQVASTPQKDFQITEETEVLLDGKACRY